MWIGDREWEQRRARAPGCEVKDGAFPAAAWPPSGHVRRGLSVFLTPIVLRPRVPGAVFKKRGAGAGGFISRKRR